MIERIPVLWPLLFYSVFVFTIAVLILVSSWLLGERHKEHYTGIPYESGMIPFGSARLRVFIRFYLVALLFVIFDLESAFIFAWAVAVRDAGWAGMVEMVIFIGVLTAALIYLVRQDALNLGPIIQKADATAVPEETADVLG